MRRSAMAGLAVGGAAAGLLVWRYLRGGGDDGGSWESPEGPRSPEAARRLAYAGNEFAGEHNGAGFTPQREETSSVAYGGEELTPGHLTPPRT